MLCVSSDGDVEFAVAWEMDPEMEDEFEKFVAENETDWLTNGKPSS